MIQEIDYHALLKTIAGRVRACREAGKRYGSGPHENAVACHRAEAAGSAYLTAMEDIAHEFRGNAEVGARDVAAAMKAVGL